MEFVPAGQTLSFEVTFDQAGLHVGMSVYNSTGVTPVLVQGPSAMTHVLAGTYSGKFVADAGNTYIIIKAVYTDGSFTVLDSDYSQGSESILADNMQSGGSSNCCGVIGLIEGSDELLGFIDNNDQILGFVEDNQLIGLVEC